MPDFCNTKLAKLLALLDPKECKLFAKWLDSPWCNNNPRLPPFYRLLLHYYPGFEQVRCQQEHHYLTHYHGQNYQSKTLRHQNDTRPNGSKRAASVPSPTWRRSPPAPGPICSSCVCSTKVFISNPTPPFGTSRSSGFSTGPITTSTLFTPCLSTG